jgi:F0F1-type ATP synthase membrane subunit b/b'
MRPFIAPILVGMLTVAGASGAAAQSKPASDQGTSVGMSTTRDAATERNSYTQQAQDEVRVWERKLHDFDAKAQVKATDAKASASKDLDDAWTQTKMASVRLETAGEADWTGAKASFRTASDKLVAAWRKVNPADK